MGIKIEPIEIKISPPQFGRNRAASAAWFKNFRTKIVRDKTKYGKKQRRKNAVKNWE